MTTRSFLRRFGTDIAGYTCLLLVVLLGPLPGPGGIPLLLAGLGLLSIHNSWARRLLEYVKRHSESFRALLFPQRPIIELMWDIVGSVLFISSILLVVFGNGWLIRSLTLSLGALAVVVLLNNRSRIRNLTIKIKR